MLGLCRPMTAIVGIFLLSRLSSAAEAHSDGPTVFLNSVPVLELRSDSALGNPIQAARIVAKRLSSVDDQGDVKVGHDGANLVIRVAGVSVITATPGEALVNKISLVTLTNRWASCIRDALALPPLKFSLEALQAPVGATQEISLVGSLASTASIASSNEKIVRVGYSAGRLSIKCLGVGEAELRATSGNVSRTLNVSVRPVAANLPQEFLEEVR